MKCPGPVTNDQVLQAIAQGQVPEGSSMCVTGESAWRPIRTIAAFADAFDRRGPPQRSGPISVAPNPGGTPEVRMSLKMFVVLCAGGFLLLSIVLVIALVMR